MFNENLRPVRIDYFKADESYFTLILLAFLPSAFIHATCKAFWGGWSQSHSKKYQFTFVLECAAFSKAPGTGGLCQCSCKPVNSLFSMNLMQTHRSAVPSPGGNLWVTAADTAVVINLLTSVALWGPSLGYGPRPPSSLDLGR